MINDVIDKTEPAFGGNSIGEGVSYSFAQRPRLTEEFCLIIGPKRRDLYLPLFEQYEIGGPKLGWHWPAFFFTFWWLIYRKMYGRAFVYILISYFCAVFTSKILGPLPIIGTLAEVVYLILLLVIPALIAKRSYYSHGKKLIARAGKSSDNVQKQHAILSAKGGTAHPILVVLLSFLLPGGIGIIAAIVFPAYQDYVLRNNAVESLGYGRQLANDIGKYYHDNARLPDSLTAVGIQATKPESLERIEFNQRSGVLTLYMKGSVQGNNSLQLVPTYRDKVNIEWVCRNVDLRKFQLPGQCRTAMAD